MRSFQVCSARASFWETVMRSRKACSSLTPRSVARARLRISVFRDREWNIWRTSYNRTSYSVDLLPATPEPASTRKQNTSNRSGPWCHQPHLFNRSRLFRSGSFGSKTLWNHCKGWWCASPKIWQDKRIIIILIYLYAMVCFLFVHPTR